MFLYFDRMYRNQCPDIAFTVLYMLASYRAYVMFTVCKNGLSAMSHEGQFTPTILSGPARIAFLLGGICVKSLS